MSTFSKKDLIFVSLMLFSMFFGAGNLIFPAFLGQSAGEHLFLSITGFIISAVGLPILGVIAIAKAGSFQTLCARVHPLFAFIFPLIIYISIGPALAIPRAGSLAFEMGMSPFLPEKWAHHPLLLFVYSVLFFGIVFWLSLSPSKLVDRFGKLLTPIVLLLILTIFVKSLVSPMGTFGAPKGNYAANPAFQGFLDGYLTMDALAALAFGIIVANTLRAKGVQHSQKLSGYMMVSGLGAGLLLTIIYVILGFLGASSASLGKAENGAQILTNVAHYLFGGFGTLLLGIVFTLACLCVSIGLVTSCSQYFEKILPRVSYKWWVTMICMISLFLTNLGLTEILKVSVPVLGAIYPVAIVLIILALIHPYIKRSHAVYGTTVIFVAAFSVIDTVNKTFFGNALGKVFEKLPLYSEGVGWIVPGAVGFIIGFVMFILKKENGESEKVDVA